VPPYSAHEGEPAANERPGSHLLPAKGSQYGAVDGQSKSPMQASPALTRSVQDPPEQRRLSTQGVVAGSQVAPDIPLGMQTRSEAVFGAQYWSLGQVSPGLPQPVDTDFDAAQYILSQITLPAQSYLLSH